MLIRQEEMQRQDELEEIALKEELEAIEIELRRQRPRIQRKNVQKYQLSKKYQLAKKLLRLLSLFASWSLAEWKTKLSLMCEHFTNSYFTRLSYKYIFTLHTHVLS